NRSNQTNQRRKVMFNNFIKNHHNWLSVAGATALVALVAFLLLAALLSPMENTHNLPVALVNGDQGATAGPQAVNFGNDLAGRLTGPQPTDSLKWTVLPDRQSAYTGVREGKYYGALV